MSENRSNTIVCGDALTVLRELPNACMCMCVTSPPYWGLRDYKVDGQIGLEKTPEEYVDKMVQVFREVRRVLRDDGTLWLNLGDSYVSAKGRYSSSAQTLSGKHRGEPIENNRPDLRGHPLLKDKDLAGIPWRVAFALQADGWYLRQDIIWHKPNPMPESIRDRCTKAHEYVFLLSKRPYYYFDWEALAEEASYDGRQDTKMKGSVKYANAHCYLPNGQNGHGAHSRGHERWPLVAEDGTKLRRRRSVWTIAPRPYKGAHFATFPEELVELCIKAGSRALLGIVLDPFIGSGTTAVAALRLKRRFFGIELNPAYVELANHRIETYRRESEVINGNRTETY